MGDRSLKCSGSAAAMLDGSKLTIWRLSVLKTGTLVSWRGSVGLVMGPCKKRWAKDDDVYVKWTDESKLKIESSRFLEVLNASR